ncbi:unnamed protein product [Prunus armeniaca]
MQRNYVTLEACANRVLGITQAPEASASGRAGPLGVWYRGSSIRRCGHSNRGSTTEEKYDESV